jgi:transcriptional antiterminator RfaH
MSCFKQGWYVLYTKPRMDKCVVGKLKEIKLEVFAPVKKVLKSWHDRRKVVDVFIFPSYVFVYLCTIKDYYRCIDTDGALNFVRFGSEIATVSSSLMDNLRIATVSANDITVSENMFPPGERMHVKNGPLAGLSCEIVKVDGKDRALVRVSLLKRNILLSLSSKSLLAFSE